MQHHKLTQNERVLAYMKKFGSITPLEAMNVIGVMRLAARISDLKKRGHKITSKTVLVKNRYGESCSVKQYSFQEEELEQ